MRSGLTLAEVHDAVMDACGESYFDDLEFQPGHVARVFARRAQIGGKIGSQ